MASANAKKGSSLVENSVITKLPADLRAGETYCVPFRLVTYEDGQKISRADIEKQLDELLQDALLEGERDLS